MICTGDMFQLWHIVRDIPLQYDWNIIELPGTGLLRTGFTRCCERRGAINAVPVVHPHSGLSPVIVEKRGKQMARTRKTAGVLDVSSFM